MSEERLLKSIDEKLSTLTNYAGFEPDTTALEERLDRIADTLDNISDALERQIGVLYELRDTVRDAD